MKTIKTERHTFKQVTHIQGDYKVWNITSIGEGCVPLFQDLDGTHVNAETLQYIQTTKEEAEVLSDAASWGIRTLADCIKALNNKRKGAMSNRKRYLAERALPAFEKYTK